MKKGNELNLRKILFINKLALVIVLLFMVIKTVLISGDFESTLAPASARGGDMVYVSEMITPLVLSLEDCAEIIERNPFDIPDRMDKGRRATKSNFTDSGSSVSEELGLALFGTVSGNPVVARAIIKDLKTNELDLYKIGQKVADAYIESIDSDEVTLAQNGQRKILRFSNAYPRSGSSDEVSYSTAAEENTTEEAHISPEYKRTNFGAIRRCIDVILKKGDVELYVVGGRVEGLRITGVENIKEVKDMGLKNGDIIHSINGQRLTSKQKAYQVFKKARTQPDINLEILRDNETKTLSFSLW